MQDRKRRQEVLRSLSRQRGSGVPCVLFPVDPIRTGHPCGRGVGLCEASARLVCGPAVRHPALSAWPPGAHAGPTWGRRAPGLLRVRPQQGRRPGVSSVGQSGKRQSRRPMAGAHGAEQETRVRRGAGRQGDRAAGDEGGATQTPRAACPCPVPTVANSLTWWSRSCCPLRGPVRPGEDTGDQRGLWDLLADTWGRWASGSVLTGQPHVLVATTVTSGPRGRCLQERR